MATNGKTTLKIALLVLPVIFFSSISLGSEIDNPKEEYDSFYKYSVLESKVNVFNPEGDVVVLLEENTSDEDNIKKLENITERQMDSIEKSDQAMSTIEARTRVRTFLLGNRLRELRFHMVEMKDQTISLEALALKTEYTKNKIQIASQIKLLKEKQEKIGNFLREKENEFSLFEWLVSSL